MTCACCGMGCFGLHKGKVADYDDELDCDACFLGAEGAGKTLLIQRLQGLHDPTTKLYPHTFPTSGTETSNVDCQRHPRFRRIKVREVGGCMAPIWHKYYEECRSVVFVVDAAAPDTLTGAASQLHTLLQHDSLKGKSCLLVLNKIDSASALPREELDQKLDVQQLLDACTGSFAVIEASALEGGEGAWVVLAWLEEDKLSRQQAAHPA